MGHTEESNGVGGSPGHPSAIAQGRLSRKAREVGHPVFPILQSMTNGVMSAGWRRGRPAGVSDEDERSQRPRPSTAWTGHPPTFKTGWVGQPPTGRRALCASDSKALVYADLLSAEGP